MRFGGLSQFGRAQFGGDPYGPQPGYVVRRMIAALEPFRKIGTTGHLNTLQRLTGTLDSEETHDLLLKAGAPAMLVAYLGGPFVNGRTSGATFIQTARYAVVCIASTQYDRIERVEGRNIYSPGVDNMVRWALRSILREMLPEVSAQTGEVVGGTQMVQNFRPVVERPLMFGPARFAIALEFEAEQCHDARDDFSSNLLERLGIVHTPKAAPEPLFETDNVTPNSDDATAVSPAVADLTDGT